jgi:hypothetical protein
VRLALHVRVWSCCVLLVFRSEDGSFSLVPFVRLLLNLELILAQRLVFTWLITIVAKLSETDSWWSSKQSLTSCDLSFSWSLETRFRLWLPDDSWNRSLCNGQFLGGWNRSSLIRLSYWAHLYIFLEQRLELLLTLTIGYNQHVSLWLRSFKLLTGPRWLLWLLLAKVGTFP